MVRVFNPGSVRSSNGIGFGKKYRRSGSINAKQRKAYKANDATKLNYYKLKQEARKHARTTRSANPPKRKLSLAQKLHFGTKRQRAAAGLMLSMAGKRKRVANGRYQGSKPGNRQHSSGYNRKLRKTFKAWNKTGEDGPNPRNASMHRKVAYLAAKSQARKEARIGNPGEIITLAGLAGNPGRLRKRKVGNIMAKRRRKSVSGVRRRTRRVRRANPNVVVRYSRRRRNTGRVRSMRRTHRRRTHRRSNPGFLSGGVGMLVGIFGGAALTGAIAARIPGQLSSGIAGYLTTGVVAYAQGTLAGKLLKNPTLGKNMVTGGLIYLGLKIAGDLIPGLSLPFGLSGLGAIGSSNFSYPQIPASNTMLYATPTPVMAAAKGMGRIARMGRGY